MSEQLKSLQNRYIELQCDVNAVLVPDGQVAWLEKGRLVRVLQALGDNISIDVDGRMFRISQEGASALGDDYVANCQKALDIDDSLSVKNQAYAYLKTCYDPEIPVDLMSLGLIYGVNHFQDDDHDTLHIIMTLTSPTCGMGPILVEEVKRKLMRIKGVNKVDVELVFDPPWSQEMMSDEAKLQLNMFW